MVSPRKEQQPPRTRNDPTNPATHTENARNAQTQNARPAHRKSSEGPTRGSEGLTRGRDQIARDMATEGSQTRGRDQTAREMAERRRQK